MPNKDELINQIFVELSKNDTDPSSISVIDLNYEYGQLKVENTPPPPKRANIATSQVQERKSTNFPIPEGIRRPCRHTYNIS